MSFLLRREAAAASTMDLAKELAALPGAAAVIAIADFQSSGRGRIPGRTWSAAPGSALLCTVGLRELGQGLGALPLRAGLAAADALRPRFPGLDLRLKWPNDLLAAPAPGAPHRKLGGLLCEASGAWFYAGLGLNLLASAYPEELKPGAVSLQEALGADGPAAARIASPESREALARGFGEALLSRLAAPAWKKDYVGMLWGLGEEIEFLEGHPDRGMLRRGVILGVEDSGALVLGMADGTERSFVSGEIGRLRSAGGAGRNF